MKAYNEKEVAREAKAMTRNQVILKAIDGTLSWIQAAQVLRISPRHLRRLKWRYEKYGFDGLRDYRAGRPRTKRIPLQTVKKLLELRKKHYMDFSVQHFHEFVTERHGLEISYNWTRILLQEAGLAEKFEGRGKYRRQRERRPMRGMLVHLDGSTHEWIQGLPQHDLILALDDADGKGLYGRFEPEGTMSTFRALKHILKKHGRFAELYHDCGSHFGRTSHAGQGPDEEQNGQITRALKLLGIGQIFARSPQARGRSERAFGTFQGRLPQELRLAGITDYTRANEYLQKQFLPDFNRRFTVKPAQLESAFVPMLGLDFDLILSAQHERTVRNDNTVTFNRVTLQLPPGKKRIHFVRCKVIVHEFTDNTLGVSFQGSLLARYTQDGELLQSKRKAKENVA